MVDEEEMKDFNSWINKQLTAEEPKIVAVSAGNKLLGGIG